VNRLTSRKPAALVAHEERSPLSFAFTSLDTEVARSNKERAPVDSDVRVVVKLAISHQTDDGRAINSFELLVSGPDWKLNGHTPVSPKHCLFGPAFHEPPFSKSPPIYCALKPPLCFGVFHHDDDLSLHQRSLRTVPLLESNYF
jgi:hypothetical protein